MRKRKRSLVGHGLVCGLMACGPQSEGETGDTGSADTDASTAGTTALADSTGGSSTGAEWEAPLARGGITVTWVQANQGVGVDIGRDGGGVGPADRAAPLIKDRITLIRAFWDLPDDWVPREIEGRMTVTYADGTEESFSDVKEVSQESFEGDLGRCFFWGLMADQTQPGLQYRIELYETSPDYDALPEGGTPPTLPSDGSNTYVGIEDSYQVLKAVVVPYNYDDGANCVTEADVSEETMQLYQDLMFMQNPLDRLEYEVHEPVQWNTPLTAFSQLHEHLVGLRFDEGALPETYYYGLVDVCSGGLGGAGGQANGIPSEPVDPNMAAQRVSAGLSLNADWSAETFVHEVGHSQGRRHVACDGEGGPDPSYPHAGGDVGEWGFGVIDFGLRHPTFNKDYMTYCHPTWVGSWGWNKVYPVIRGLSEWDDGFPGNGAPGPDPDGAGAAVPEGQLEDPYSGSMLMGWIEPDGSERWVTVPGGLPQGATLETAMHLELAANGRVLADVPVHVQTLQDGAGTQLVMAPLPDLWPVVTQVTRIDGARRVALPRATITEHHHKRFVRR